MEFMKKLKMVGDMKNFSWPEAFSDKDGKSSITAIIGAFITLVGGIGFIVGLFKDTTTILPQATMVILFGGGVITGRKIMNGKPVMEDVLASAENKST